ncbi:MAG: DRTGG domain-containing protein [bacterium]
MEKLIIASTQKRAGKTSVTVGLTKALGKSCGYLKPFGDRLLYRKKQLWDYDAALMSSILGLEGTPENMSIGFEHSKFRYIYDEETTKAKVIERAAEAGRDKDLLIVEGGGDLRYGASIHLDALSVAGYLSGRLLLIVGGDEYVILDDLTFIKENIGFDKINLAGVIINNVKDVQDFKETHLRSVNNLGVNVLGIIPHVPELTYMSVRYLIERTFAKVIAGEGGLDNIVKNVFIGALSAGSYVNNPAFTKECKLIITGGDRSDIILAALESGTSCIILTNNILPPSIIISKAHSANVPLLLVPWDTHYTAKQIDGMEALLTKDDSEKIELLKRLVLDNVDISGI